MTNFISNWYPAKYWNWNDENFKLFIDHSSYLRFTKCDIIYGNVEQTSDTIYFILNGNIELIRVLRIPVKSINKKKEKNKKDEIVTRLKFYKIWTLTSQNYFGLEDENSIDSWYIAKNDVNLITISIENFKKIHPYAEFLLVKLKEDLKFWKPTVIQEMKYYKEELQWKKFLSKKIF